MVIANEDLMKQYRSAIRHPDVLKSLKENLPADCAGLLSPDRIVKLALTTLSRNPKLLGCDVKSIIRCLVECAQLGLEPGGSNMAEVYLVPFNTKAPKVNKTDPDKWVSLCQNIISQHGYIKTARRNKSFGDINAACVYKGDTLRDRRSLIDGHDFLHEPGPDCSYEDKDIIGAYCMWREGPHHKVYYMPRIQIEKRRAASKNSGGTWEKWYPEMCCKTVVKHAARYWPKTVEMTAAMDADEADPTEQEYVIEQRLGSGNKKADRSEELLQELEQKQLAD